MKRKSMMTALPLAALLGACASSAPAPEANEPSPVGPYTLDEGRPVGDVDGPMVPDVELANVPDSDPQVIPVEGDAKVAAPTVHRVLFAEGQWTIGTVGSATIETAANQIRANPLAKVEIVAHADDALDEREDLVARRRADAVVEKLVAEGVDGSRIRVTEAADHATGRQDVQIRVFAPSRVAAQNVVPVDAK